MKYFLLFLLLFDPQIPLFPNGVGFSFIIFLSLTLALLLKGGGRLSNRYLFNAATPLLLMHSAVLLMSMFVLIVAGDNFKFLFGVWKSIVLFGAIFSFLLYYNEKFDGNFFRALLLCYTLNGAINFTAGTFPEHFQWIDLFQGELITDDVGTNPFRNNFISGSGFFSIGTAYGMFLLFYAHYIGTKGSLNTFQAFSLLLVAVAGFFGARTASLAIVAALALLIIRVRIYYTIPALIAAYLIIIYLFADDGFFGAYRAWAQSFLLLEDDPSGYIVLNEMHFWPGEKIFFLGSGFEDGRIFNHTDSGFMKDILFGGVFYSLLNFSIPIIFAIMFFRRFPIFVLLFFCVSFAFQMKGEFFLSNAQGMSIVYLIYFYFYKISFGELSGRRKTPPHPP